MRSSTSNTPFSRQALVLGGLVGLLSLVVLVVFLDLRRLVGARSPTEPDPTPEVGRARATATWVAPGVLPTAPLSGGHLVRYADEMGSFSLDLLPIWHGPTLAEPIADNGPEQRHVLFEQADTGARLTISIWTHGSPESLTREWVQGVAPGLSSIDGRWPTNAVIGGDPALIAWSDEAPDAPARYAALGLHVGNAYRLAYSAADGGVLLPEFARALVSLEWSETATPDLVPPLPKPAGRFYPPWTDPVGDMPTSPADRP